MSTNEQNQQIQTQFQQLFAQAINLGNYSAVPNGVWGTLQQNVLSQLQMKDSLIEHLQKENNELRKQNPVASPPKTK